MASIQILKGANTGQRIPLTGDRTVLGRNPDCEIVIQGTAVSRAHAHIVRIDGEYYIEDLNSRNGTFVNNESITVRTKLKDNDRIKICDTLFSFHEKAPVKPLPGLLAPEEPEPLETATAQVEATVVPASTKKLLETQPAEKIKALIDITNHLCKTLELESLMPRITSSLFDLFRQADRVFVLLQDESGKRVVPKLVKTRRGQDETNARWSRSVVARCMEHVEALLSEDASSDSRFALSQSIADFRIRSVMCAPLCGQDGKAFGVIQMDTQDRAKRFTQDDLNLLMAVANQASVALENVRLHQEVVARERLTRDLELAREVQRSFLPTKPPEAPGYQFFSHYESAYEVGGDAFDFVKLPGDRLGIVLADVAGKGVPAALLMAKISADVRFCLLTEPDPARALRQLNALMHESGLTERFVTMALAVLDLSRHVVTLANAGHPSPLVFRPGKNRLEEATPIHMIGLPLGVMENYPYEACEIELRPSESFFVFSDGIPDAMSTQNKAFGIQGIHDAILSFQSDDPPSAGVPSPTVLGERLIRVVKEFSSGRSQHDDMTLVCCGRLGSSDPLKTAKWKPIR
jgi:serine phosphatase RsbU (regulator of sigma subunit)/pSer/pThr/pTyr-binding forkhead associated (FHA) protein